MRLLLTFLSLLGSITLLAQEEKKDTSYVFIPDDPIVAMLDSMQLTKYFECNSYLSDSCLFDVENYKPSFIPYFDDIVYEARLAQLDQETPFDLVYNKAVKAYIDMYSLRKRILVSRLIGLSQVYFPMFEEKLAKYNLPLELKYLAIVESALNPNAISKSGAGGLWQFMYPTGKMFNLEVNSYVDDRRDPLKATEAACRYFNYLYGMFGDWQMVLAAYNCGPGTLNKAIRRSGNKKTYWEVRPYLPLETQGYVPAFIAVNYLMNYTKEHNIVPIPAKQIYFYADTVHVKQAVSFDAISQVIDIAMEDLVFLNPNYKLKRVPGYDRYNHLYLPANKVGAFINNETAIYSYIKREEQIRDSIMVASLLSEPIRKTHVVKKGETINKIASKYNVTANDLKKWNKLSGNHLKLGSKLLVMVPNPNTPKINSKPLTETKDLVVSDSLKTDSTPMVSSDNNTILQKEEGITSTNSSNNKSGKIIYHTIQKGDTLWNIKNRYNMSSVDELIQINNLPEGYVLIPGGKLKVLVDSN
ncbi:MAG: transglycosylase SLT domain-containing protein [Bacteroidia bacterium]|nr:transglycosylase SLT domain-containing protein [Bacteroidia bacterium]MCZ2248884.1 transglycosylase SLT domain-containing protein [Bacteroidia bacterium]